MRYTIVKHLIFSVFCCSACRELEADSFRHTSKSDAASRIRLPNHRIADLAILLNKMDSIDLIKEFVPYPETTFSIGGVYNTTTDAGAADDSHAVRSSAVAMPPSQWGTAFNRKSVKKEIESDEAAGKYADDARLRTNYAATDDMVIAETGSRNAPKTRKVLPLVSERGPGCSSRTQDR